MDSFWESLTKDPRIPENQPMRATDADREVVRTVLADAFADGRLSNDEYDERVGVLLQSRTYGDLPPLVADLVDTGEPSTSVQTKTTGASADLRVLGERAWRREVQEAFTGWLVPSLICLVIWVAVGAGSFFWPIFPIVFIGMNPLRTLLLRESIIERKIEKLEAKGRPELEGSPAEDRSDDEDELWSRRSSRVEERMRERRRRRGWL